MSDMFEYLEAQAREENLPFRNAAVVAIDRAERRFGSFVSSAQGSKEFNARLDLVKDEIYKIAADACEEHGYDDSEHIAKLVVGQIEALAETQKLKSQDPEGYYTEPSPKLNPGSAGDNMKNTNPAIPELTPDDSQHPTDKEWPWDSELPKANLVDADKPMQPEFNVGDKTMTFPDKGQADPVTSKTAMFDDSLNSYPGEPLGEDDYDQEHPEDFDEEVAEDESMFADDPQFDRGAFLDAHGQKSPRQLAEEEYYEAMGDGLEQRSSAAKEAAERMDFNSLSEMMTPSEAIGHLVEAGMPSHEAKDRIDFYVNHVNPGWAHKNWTSSENKESMWDTSDPDLLDMSYEVDAPTTESIRQVYQQYANSDRFESPQQAIDSLFVMFAENANTPEAVDSIAQMFNEAVGKFPSNIDQVKQYAMRFANTKTADHPGVYRDIVQMLEGALERGVGGNGRPLSSKEQFEIQKEINRYEEMANRGFYDQSMPPSMTRPEEYSQMDPASEEEVPESMDEMDMSQVKEDMSAPSTRSNPTTNIPVKYKSMGSSVYNEFLKKQAKK